MTTVSRQPCHDLPSSEARGTPIPPSLTLSWSLPAAPPVSDSRRTLEITIDGQSAAASLLIDDRRTELARPTPLALVFEREHNLWHADAPGLIAATWREAREGIEVLFARTPLLERLGLRGGTHDFTGARPA